ncbi:MAG: GTPase HflX [Anaerolineaceae bacterium]|nr:GTPase HflX [Anaerolineaceae bacterium]
MSKKIAEPTSRPRERAFLVGVDLYGDNHLLSLENSLAELALLADTAGLDVIGDTSQHLSQPNPNTFIGTGKVEEIRLLLEETLADVVLFDVELSPRHLRELEEKFGPNIQVVDRTALILDIFAQHARTAEGILQVQLAQYEYRLPRLTRAWTHLARQAGGAAGRSGSAGGVGLRGPGETQLEVDKRDIRRGISHMKEELEKVRAHRSRYRAQRKRSHIPVVALVGYTNAGKSTLLNRLAKAAVYVADQLFATLDPTTRRVQLPGGHLALFTDTVGFIQKLPTQLVAAFRATLEEISDADLLVHVIDISHPNALSQAEAVHQTLKEIGAAEIPTISVLNKIDRLPDPQLAVEKMKNYPNSVAVSALKKVGVDVLMRQIETQLFEQMVPIKVRLPYKEGQLISLFHDQGQVEKVEHGRGGVTMQGLLPGRLLVRFQPFMQVKHAELETE